MEIIFVTPPIKLPSPPPPQLVNNDRPLTLKIIIRKLVFIILLSKKKICSQKCAVKVGDVPILCFSTFYIYETVFKQLIKFY